MKLFKIEEGSYINVDKIIKIDEKINVEDVAVKVYLHEGFSVNLSKEKWERLFHLMRP